MPQQARSSPAKTNPIRKTRARALFRPPTGAASLDADSTDELTDSPRPPEVLELFKTGPVVKVSARCQDGPRWTSGQAVEAISTTLLYRLIRLQWRIREDRGQTKLRTVLGVDEKVVPADPA